MKKEIKFLVTHGIGKQEPYVILDLFTNGLLKIMIKEEYIISHNIESIDNREYTYIKIETESKIIKIYEYYWAFYRDDDVSLDEAINWFTKGIMTHNTIEKDDNNDKTQQKILNKTFNRARSLAPLIKIIYPFLKNFTQSGLINMIINKIFNLQFIEYMQNYITDLVIYTSADTRSKNFNTKNNMINNAIQAIKDLYSDNSEIILIGHSLGSALMYDCINKINIESNYNNKSKKLLKSIKGIVTLGSPINKIRYFFEESSKEEQFIRKQIIDSNRCFRSKDRYITSTTANDTLNSEKYTIKKIDNNTKNIQWINIYNSYDYISGKLKDYVIEKSNNIDITEEINTKDLIKAHDGYWKSDIVYNKIYDEFIA
ncbi:MAG: hypothetical protein COA66_02380 [Arcobacter sp.]|nr:MAG: hypothetical protein COA66_02380 [Arcobacter sp.]